MFSPELFFDLKHFSHSNIFSNIQTVWTPLANLNNYLENWFSSHRSCQNNDVSIAETARIYGAVSFGSGSLVEDGACIVGPAVIGEDCEIRQGAYIRGNCLMGDRCILGHASELKNSIMLNDAKAPHFAYVGDSILGNNVNLGAGTKLSNLTISTKKNIKSGLRPTLKLSVKNKIIDTGLSKLGAIVGDNSQTGCNAVTNPGTIIGKNTLVYANTSVAKGLVPENSIVKLRQVVEITERNT